LKNAVGASILTAAPGIDSAVEKRMVSHFFFGNGQPFILTSGESARYAQNPLSSEFSFGIGRANPGANGRIDVYDFDPQPWGNRTNFAEVATRGANNIGNTFGGQAFDVFLPTNKQ